MDFDTSFLPRLTLFKQGKALSTLKSLNSVVHSSNANLSTAKKLWLKWHYKLGHIGFKHVLTLALGGFLDRAALALHSCDLSSRPTCAACQHGKQVLCAPLTTPLSPRRILKQSDPSRQDSLCLVTESSATNLSPEFKEGSCTQQDENLTRIVSVAAPHSVMQPQDSSGYNTKSYSVLPTLSMPRTLSSACPCHTESL